MRILDTSLMEHLNEDVANAGKEEDAEDDESGYAGCNLETFRLAHCLRGSEALAFFPRNR